MKYCAVVSKARTRYVVQLLVDVTCTGDVPIKYAGPVGEKALVITS